MAVILLVEDDFALAMGTEYALQAEGYEVIRAANLADARRIVGLEDAKAALDRSAVPDLVLLDVMLPDGNGYDFCRELRRINPQIPIIFLTAVAEEVNIVQGLELGADDYVTKPYRVKELLSRITANLRRLEMIKNLQGQTQETQTERYQAVQTSDGANDRESGSYRAGECSGDLGQRESAVPVLAGKARYCFGNHQLDVQEFRLYSKGTIVDITPGEFRLLKELVQNDGIVLTRNQLLERLYDTGESFVDDNTLSVYMKRLRDKLGEDAVWIETVRGVGYRFKKREER